MKTAMNSNEFVSWLSKEMNTVYERKELFPACELAKKIIDQIKSVEKVKEINMESIRNLREELDALREKNYDLESELEEAEWIIECYKLQFGDLDDQYKEEDLDEEE